MPHIADLTPLQRDALAAVFGVAVIGFVWAGLVLHWGFLAGVLPAWYVGKLMETPGP
jgi:hypothetical protein